VNGDCHQWKVSPLITLCTCDYKIRVPVQRPVVTCPVQFFLEHKAIFADKYLEEHLRQLPISFL
jgi:hypothetical protein